MRSSEGEAAAEADQGEGYEAKGSGGETEGRACRLTRGGMSSREWCL